MRYAIPPSRTYERAKDRAYLYLYPNLARTPARARRRADFPSLVTRLFPAAPREPQSILPWHFEATREAPLQGF